MAKPRQRASDPKPTVLKKTRRPASKPSAKAPAEPVNLTESPEATIRRLAGEVEQFSRWWHTDRKKAEKLQRRVAELEGTLRAIAMLARVDLGEFVDRRDHRIPDDEIPF